MKNDLTSLISIRKNFRRFSPLNLVINNYMYTISIRYIKAIWIWHLGDPCRLSEAKRGTNRGLHQFF